MAIICLKTFPIQGLLEKVCVLCFNIGPVLNRFCLLGEHMKTPIAILGAPGEIKLGYPAIPIGQDEQEENHQRRDTLLVLRQNSDSHMAMQSLLEGALAVTLLLLMLSNVTDIAASHNETSVLLGASISCFFALLGFQAVRQRQEHTIVLFVGANIALMVVALLRLITGILSHSVLHLAAIGMGVQLIRYLSFKHFDL